MEYRALVVATLLLAGCAGAPRLIAPKKDVMRRADFTAIIAAHPLPAGQNISAVVLGRTATLSYHLVQIRDREQPHIHADHDLVVTLLRGTGTLYVLGTPQPMRAGDVAVVPRGTPHYFVNTAFTPSVAFVTFAPPYNGNDQVPAPR